MIWPVIKSCSQELWRKTHYLYDGLKDKGSMNRVYKWVRKGNISMQSGCLVGIFTSVYTQKQQAAKTGAESILPQVSPGQITQASSNHHCSSPNQHCGYFWQNATKNKWKLLLYKPSEVFLLEHLTLLIMITFLEKGEDLFPDRLKVSHIKKTV